MGIKLFQLRPPPVFDVPFPIVLSKATPQEIVMPSQQPARRGLQCSDGIRILAQGRKQLRVDDGIDPRKRGVVVQGPAAHGMNHGLLIRINGRPDDVLFSDRVIRGFRQVPDDLQVEGPGLERYQVVGCCSGWVAQLQADIGPPDPGEEVGLVGLQSARVQLPRRFEVLVPSNPRPLSRFAVHLHVCAGVHVPRKSVVCCSEPAVDVIGL